MAEIKVLKGLRYTPDMFLKRMAKSKKLKDTITMRYVTTLYSLCWIFQLRIALQATRKTTRYAGYYAGFDEIAMTPGKLAMLPSCEPQDVAEACILQDKLTEEEALQKSWEYNKTGIFRKFRNLNAPPVLEEYVTERMYKPLYLFEFYNTELDEKKIQGTGFSHGRSGGYSNNIRKKGNVSLYRDSFPFRLALLVSKQYSVYCFAICSDALLCLTPYAK